MTVKSNIYQLNNFMTEEQQFEKYPVTGKDIPTQKSVSAEPMQETKTTDPTHLKPFKVEFQGVSAWFYLRVISTTEEDEVAEKFAAFAELEGEEDKKKQYQICLDALHRFSVKNGVDKKVSTYGLINERIIRTAWISFKNQLIPGVSFLPNSAL